MKAILRILPLAIACLLTTASADARGRNNSGDNRQAPAAQRDNSRSNGSRQGAREARPGSGFEAQKAQPGRQPGNNANPGGQRPGNNGGGNMGPGNGGQRPGNNGGGNMGPGNGGQRPGNSGGNMGPGNVGQRPGNGGGNMGPGNGGQRPGNSGGNGGPGHGGQHPGGNMGPGHNHNHDHGPGGFGPGPGPHPGHISHVPPRPPYRPLMPVNRPYRPPMPPAHFRPMPGCPVIGSILGVAIGTAINVSLNYLLHNGYAVAGYSTDAVYINNVNQLNMLWPNATLYYNNAGYLIGSEFVYSTPYYDINRYNMSFNYLVNAYGAPVSSMPLNGGGMQVSWFGANGQYVSLQYQPGNAYDGTFRYYTTLSFGI